MEAPARKTPRFWVAMQPSIIRLYKVAGLVELTAILVGLIGFLVVNVFYFFDHTWVRPVVLSPTHQKVVDASNQLTEARSHQSQVEGARLDKELQVGRRIPLKARIDSLKMLAKEQDGLVHRLEQSPYLRAV